jgi:hypothetical protein
VASVCRAEEYAKQDTSIKQAASVATSLHQPGVLYKKGSRTPTCDSLRLCQKAGEESLGLPLEMNIQRDVEAHVGGRHAIRNKKRMQTERETWKGRKRDHEYCLPGCHHTVGTLPVFMRNLLPPPSALKKTAVSIMMIYCMASQPTRQHSLLISLFVTKTLRSSSSAILKIV